MQSTQKGFIGIGMIIAIAIGAAIVAGGATYVAMKNSDRGVKTSTETSSGQSNGAIMYNGTNEAEDGLWANNPYVEDTQSKAVGETGVTVSGNTTVATGVTTGRFVNPQLGYNFVVPAGWKAAVNEYAPKNSLFGPDATGKVGSGGVEVRNATSVDAHLSYFEANAEIKYTNRTEITVDGVTGVKAHYEGYPSSGEAVLLFKDGYVYNIFVDGKNASDIVAFNKVVASFKFK